MAKNLTAEQGIQEHEYTYPYHHIPEFHPFTQTRNLWWGYEYASYIEFLVGTCKTLGFTKFIDIGCGDGRLLAELARSGDIELYGTDFSEKALSFARAFCPPSVRLSTTIPTERFDSFAAIEVFEHIPPDEADSFLDSVRSILLPEARGIITVPTTNVPLNPKHYRHFTDESMRAALSKHFIVESIEFLNARSMTAKIVQRLLANRFFILNWQPLKNALYAWYKKTSLITTPERAMRLLVTVRAKP